MNKRNENNQNVTPDVKALPEGKAEVRKKQMRRILKRRRSHLTEEYKKKADGQILHHVIQMPEYKKAETVFCYVGIGDEIDTRTILQHILDAGKRLGVPRCIQKGVMEVCMVTDLSQLKPGMYGIPEPVGGCPVFLPGEIDLALVPCLSCSRDGARLGYGGGYYDRYLVRTKCMKTVLCWEEMMTEEIPTQEWDLKMDAVITEKGRW